MKNVRIIPLLAIAALLLAACTAETDGSQPSGTAADVLTDVTITLTPEVPQEVQTRMPANEPDLTTLQELYILQYDQSGNLLTSISPAEFTVQGSSYVMTKGTLKNQPGKIYVITNDGDEMQRSIGKETYLHEQMNIHSEDDLFPISKAIMSGVYVGTPTPKMSIPLTRTVAMLMFSVDATLPAGHTFTLESVQLKQVPNTMGVHDGSVPLPYPSKSGVFDYPVNTSMTLGGERAVYFVPENLRGTGTATSELDKNATTAPAGQAALCTYVEIKGKYDSGANWVGKLDVAYRIYLGGNNTNDYNLRRNTNYTVNTVIKGANRADTRITVTGTENQATYKDYTDNNSSWFAIAKTDANTARVSYIEWMTGTGTGADGGRCPTGWRLPLKEELMLMYIYGHTAPYETSPTDDINFQMGKYYISNSSVTEPEVIDLTAVWCLAASHMGRGAKDLVNNYVRCIRDY